ncbi:MAG: SUMF1/EgtB/PvdO family nonheme iron enzyme [Marinifilaceae bacterium]
MCINRSFVFSLVMLLLGTGLNGMAQKNNSWQQQYIALKERVKQGKVDGQVPAVSEVLRHRKPAQRIVMDVSKIDSLVLTTNGTADGNNWDHAVFGNPVLTDKQGKTISLTEIKPVYAKGDYDTPLYNHNFAKKTLKINNTPYEKGILLHANGKMIYKLDKKYKTLEVEVGIDDNATSASSVLFQISDTRFNPSKLLATLPNSAGEKITSFAQRHRLSTEVILTKADGSVERGAVIAAMKQLPDQSYFTNEIAKIEKLPAAKQIPAYMDLADLAVEVADLSTQLSWVNTEALSAYVADMKGNSAFDIKKGEAMLKSIKDNYAGVKAHLYANPVEYAPKAKQLLADKRALVLDNPYLESDRIVVSRFKLGEGARSAMGPNVGMPANNWSSMYSASRRSAGGEIAELTNLKGDVKVRTIYKPENNKNVADLQINWDADKLLFSSLDDKNRWQIYEVGVDGNGLTQKIKVDETDLEFCDANYLPDGRIIASSNIGYNGVPCVHGSDEVGNLTIYDPAKGSLRRLTFDQDGNWNPVVMNNGRVMYTRWEYTDLTHYFSRIIMHMNPDGTENKALYGSGSFWPNSTFDIKPIPGHSSQFIGVISGHHGIARSGRLMLFDPTKSRKEEKGVVQELPFKDRKIVPEIKDYLVDGVWPQFLRPYPLNDKYFLVAAKLSPKSLWGIYLIDVFDNLTCIAEFEGEGLNMPLLVEKKETPPSIPDRIKPDSKEATVFIQDIYEGEGSMGLPRGTVKELRIFSYEYAYWNSPSNHDAQGIQSGWDIKRLLGTVPVEEDGSVIFTVPANMPISIQPIDAQGRAVQWMRSWFTPMPGETVSCIGCHEDQNQIPMPKRVIASQRKPHAIKTPENGVRPFTYELEVQPILDRACVACHNDKSNMDLTGGRIDNKYPSGGHVFSKSYLAIMPYVYRQGPEADMYVLKPYEYHATNSELVRMLTKGHHGVELTDKEWRTLYNWIDFNAPYHSAFHNISKARNYDQYERRIELANKYNNGAGVDWRKEIEAYSNELKNRGEIVAEMPKAPKAVKTKEVKQAGWPLADAAQLQNSNSQTRKTIEIAPGVSMNFVWVPAGKFVMGDNNGESDARPAFKTEVKKGFWMSECEVTNEQYCALVPEHDSRIIGQFWKDHTTAGYPANKPQQPVIRVSFEEAMKYCENLASAHNAKITLPTETQWEWACRAGSDTPFWYGTGNTDFGKYENMADFQLTNMAVTGVDPKPLPQGHALRKYWDYIPKEAAVNDGEMLTAYVGKYQPNAWGLKDMHGNVAEWTRSDYVSYPLKDKDTHEKKVVRGGSWTDRPKYAASHTRKAFYPWQKVYNVGFRVIIEE